ncbi:hypothetical protein HN011_005673, partial [Eciton burchellii]
LRTRRNYLTFSKFLVAEDAYNKAADHQEVISNFVKVESSTCDGGTDSTFRDETKSSSLKLPRIAFPIFSGKFSKWENFRHTSESLVDSNDAISNILKFHYLKSSITDFNVTLLINRFQIFPENYIAAWKKLVTEYDDKKALKHAHIHSFASLPKAKSESATKLKKLRDTVSIVLAVLSKLGCHVSY